MSNINKLPLYIRFDIADQKTWDNNDVYLLKSSVNKYDFNIQEESYLKDASLTFYDFGRYPIISGYTGYSHSIPYSANTLDLYSVKAYSGNTIDLLVSGSTYDMIVTGDTSNLLVTGYTVSAITSSHQLFEANVGNFFFLDDGWFSGFFKLENYDYEVLPKRYIDGVSFNLWLYLVSDSFKDIDNNFLFLGTRSENKYSLLYTGDTKGQNVFDNYTGLTQFKRYYGEYELLTSELDELGHDITGSTQTDTMLPPIISGYTIHDLQNDTYNNVITFFLSQEGFIGAKYLDDKGNVKIVTSDRKINCDDNLNRWNNIIINFKPYEDILDPDVYDCYPQRYGTLTFFVNGVEFFKTEDFPEFMFRGLNTERTKQIGVPYTLGWGGGSFGLKHSYHINRFFEKQETHLQPVDGNYYTDNNILIERVENEWEFELDVNREILKTTYPTVLNFDNAAFYNNSKELFVYDGNINRFVVYQYDNDRNLLSTNVLNTENVNRIYSLPNIGTSFIYQYSGTSIYIRNEETMQFIDFTEQLGYYDTNTNQIVYNTNRDMLIFSVYVTFGRFFIGTNKGVLMYSSNSNIYTLENVFNSHNISESLPSQLTGLLNVDYRAINLYESAAGNIRGEIYAYNIDGEYGAYSFIINPSTNFFIIVYIDNTLFENAPRIERSRTGFELINNDLSQFVWTYPDLINHPTLQNKTLYGVRILNSILYLIARDNDTNEFHFYSVINNYPSVQIFNYTSDTLRFDIDNFDTTTNKFFVLYDSNNPEVITEYSWDNQGILLYNSNNYTLRENELEKNDILISDYSFILRDFQRYEFNFSLKQGYDAFKNPIFDEDNNNYLSDNSRYFTLEIYDSDTGEKLNDTHIKTMVTELNQIMGYEQKYRILFETVSDFDFEKTVYVKLKLINYFETVVINCVTQDIININFPFVITLYDIHIIEWIFKIEYLQDERKDYLIIEREFINNFTGGIQILEIYKHLDYNQLKLLYEFYKARYYGGCDYPIAAPLFTM